MNWDKKDIINICKIVAFGIILYWLLQNLAGFGNAFKNLCGILSPFIVGAAIAFVVNIPMTLLEIRKIRLVKKKKKKLRRIKFEDTLQEERKVSKWKRLVSILISLIIIILIIVGVVFLVIPELINVIGNIINYLPELVNNLAHLTKKTIEDYPSIETTLTNLQINFESFSREMITELTALGKGVVTSSFGVISSSIRFVIDLVVSIIFAVYILMGKERIVSYLKKITYAFCRKDVADWIWKVSRLSKVAFYNFITGQFTECIILGSLCAIGMLILRLPYSATVGIIVGVTAVIPIVGAIVGALIGFVLLLSISAKSAFIFVVFFVILQQIENNLIYPKVVGSSVGVPGILVLVAVTIGGALGGAIGMIVSLPITSVLYTLLNESTKRRLEQKNIDI